MDKPVVRQQSFGATSMAAALPHDESPDELPGFVEVEGKRFNQRGSRSKWREPGRGTWDGRPAARGGPVSVRPKRSVPATRHSSTVGGRTLHYVVSEPPSPSGRRNGGGRQLRKLQPRPVRRVAAERVSLPNEFRWIPPSGELACDTELPMERLAELPDDVLGIIAAEYSSLRQGIDTAHDAAAAASEGRLQRNEIRNRTRSIHRGRH